MSTNIGGKGCVTIVRTKQAPNFDVLNAVHSLVDTVSLVLAVCAGYHFVVTDFGNPLSMLQIPT